MIAFYNIILQNRIIGHKMLSQLSYMSSGISLAGIESGPYRQVKLAV